MASGLATRCPACGTVFRVVLDQLRVSEGWVRCGRCGDVFDAGEALVDLESGAARRLVFDPPGAPAAAAATPEPGPARAPAPASFSEQDTVAELDPTPSVDDTATLPAVEPRAPALLSSGEPESVPTSPPLATPPGDESVRTPSFMRRAERAQRWRQPRMRASLAALGVALLLILAGQATYQYRESLAAHVPALRDALTAVCSALGCSIGAPRAIDHISVESSGLVRVEQSSLYRLAVALRNRAAFDVALPAIEVAISDSQGKLLARRVLRPAEMGTSQLALAAGRDLLLQATLQIATEPVAGYTIELFYP